MYYELFPTVTKYIYRIIVSTSLRHTIFNLIHATPVAGYIGEYKILYQIRLRLFLLRLRSDISGWIKKCSPCMIMYRWRRREKKQILYWPISTPFVILHVDLWILCRYTDSNGYIVLMNVMCHVSRFVVVLSIPDEYSATLASHFMQHLL